MNRNAIKKILKHWLEDILAEKQKNGFDIGDWQARMETLPDSYDAIMDAFDALADLRKREDWAYTEPEKWEDIQREMIPTEIHAVQDAERRTKAAFLASVAGCVLGKPIENNPTYAQLKAAYSAIGEWPISHFLTREMVRAYGRSDMDTSTLEGMDGADADDDINYTVIGMMVLERYGRNFTTENVAKIWHEHLPTGFTYGPEASFLRQLSMFVRESNVYFDEDWSRYRAYQDRCGAMIRADAFGYANPGNPAAAAEMAWRDGHMTHEYTGVYSEMFAAAAIAAAYSAKNPEEIVTEALKCIPQRSRLAACVRYCLQVVRETQDFETAYEIIHAKYSEYTHCLIYQEVGTLINTLFHAHNAGEGICMQVMQGNDTDSYGCTAGSILGAYFGEIDAQWVTPFHDKINLALGCAPEHSLQRLAERMGRLSSLQ